ncbi:Uncharacterized protein HZ326_6724 [Fusarium oxysporum f. sp. albedinis]|nr:Uncharacterized protein HZ326_6724 [Fusarium oxysporum f. sp. albedinis]
MSQLQIIILKVFSSNAPEFNVRLDIGVTESYPPAIGELANPITQSPKLLPSCTKETSTTLKILDIGYSRLNYRSGPPQWRLGEYKIADCSPFSF